MTLRPLGDQRMITMAHIERQAMIGTEPQARKLRRPHACTTPLIFSIGAVTTTGASAYAVAPSALCETAKLRSNDACTALITLEAHCTDFNSDKIICQT